MWAIVRYAPGMTWFEIAQSFALAFWPVWVVLAALLVVWVASRLGYMAPDEYEEPVPCGCRFGQCCGFCQGCCLEDRLERERKYHEDESWGR
jgi:hypothetical protein